MDRGLAEMIPTLQGNREREVVQQQHNHMGEEPCSKRTRLLPTSCHFPGWHSAAELSAEVVWKGRAGAFCFHVDGQAKQAVWTTLHVSSALTPICK